MCWIHIPNAFGSIVEPDPRRDRIGGDMLVVRVRVKEDLDAFRVYMPGLGPTKATPERDYPYRAFIPRQQLAEGLARIALDGITYSNFKDTVKKKLGSRRASLCAEVWAVMQRAEPRPGERRGRSR